MKTPTMLYTSPGPHEREGITYDHTIVDECDVEAKLAEGWHMTPEEAHAAHQETVNKLAANEDEQRDVEQKLQGAEKKDGAAATSKATPAAKKSTAKKGGAGASK